MDETFSDMRVLAVMSIDFLLIILATILIATSCSLSKLAPLGGAVTGGAVGAVGGPLVAGASAGVGYGAGKLYGLSSESSEVVEAISAGDVKAIAAAHLKGELAEHKSGFEKFASGVKTVLYVAGALLLAYLAIPFIYTKRCLKKQREEYETRPPFPVKRTTGESK